MRALSDYSQSEFEKKNSQQLHAAVGLPTNMFELKHHKLVGFRTEKVSNDLNGFHKLVHAVVFIPVHFCTEYRSST